MGLNKLVISYPQGSGGTWFAHLIDCLVNDNQFHQSQTNWHAAKFSTRPRVKILVNHELDDPDFNLSGDCTYNFWCYYYVKRFVYDLGGPRPVTNARGSQLRLVKCPYQSDTTARQDFEWMFLQARFIASYNLHNQRNLDYADLVHAPDRFYKTITDVLDQRGIDFRDDYQFFLQAKNTYLDSVRGLRQNAINVNHHHYRIWELAYIDGVLDRAPGFDYFDQFGSPEMQTWVDQFRDRVLEDTKKVYLKIN